MKKILLSLCAIGLLTTCDKQDNKHWSVNGDEINSIEKLSEDVIYEFYKTALDTILNENFLFSAPEHIRIVNDTSILFREVIVEDQLFFNEQLEKFENFGWDSTKVNAKIFPQKYENLIKEDLMEGWNDFRDNHREYAHLISIPLFSRDFRKVCIEYGEVWGFLSAVGYLYVFEFEDNKWVLKKKLEIWQS